MSLKTESVRFARACYGSLNNAVDFVWSLPALIFNTIVHSIGPLDRLVARLDEWAIENEIHGYENLGGSRSETSEIKQ